jgi:CMP-N,N'-diacetyllegionaminic acid synthase
MTKKIRILGLTLARGGSKSVPNKNIKIINGLPLIAYTINEALKSKYLTDYIVSTDDPKIADISKKYGAAVPFIRPAKYATDEASSASAIQHAVLKMEAYNDCKYDYVVELMATNPLKNVEDIDTCIELLMNSGCDSVIAMHRLEDHHPARIKKLVDGYIRDFCIAEPNEARRQDLEPKAYIRSGSIYALTRGHIMLDGMRYGSENSRPYILPDQRVANIDNMDDFYLTEYKIKAANK